MRALKGSEIPFGETIYYRCMCKTAAAKVMNGHGIGIVQIVPVR